MSSSCIACNVEATKTDSCEEATSFFQVESKFCSCWIINANIENIIYYAAMKY